MIVRLMVMGMLIASMVQAEYTIRYAEIADLDAIITLDRAISWEYFKPLLLQYNSDEKSIDAGLKEELTHDEKNFLKAINFQRDRRIKVACRDDVVVGFVSFSKRLDLLYIDLLMIDRKWRGCGIGKKLLNTVRNEFLGVNQMTLLVLKNNISARSFYEKYGFVENEIPEWGQPADRYSYCYYVFDLFKNKNRKLIHCDAIVNVHTSKQLTLT